MLPKAQRLAAEKREEEEERERRDREEREEKAMAREREVEQQQQQGGEEGGKKEEEKRCLVKWQGLGYHECTWALEADGGDDAEVVSHSLALLSLLSLSPFLIYPTLPHHTTPHHTMQARFHAVESQRRQKQRLLKMYKEKKYSGHRPPASSFGCARSASLFPFLSPSPFSLPFSPKPI